MKKTFRFALALLTIVAAFSCALEIETPIEDQTEEPIERAKTYEYIFRISDDSDLTKTTLEGTTVTWETGDRIGIFATGTTNKYGAISALDPVQFPVYLDAALAKDDIVYCYFPQSTANNSATANSITLTIPVSQTGDFDAMPQVAIPYVVPSAMAKGTNNVADIHFFNTAAIARFLVYSSTGAYSSETVQSIKFSANKNLAGNFTFDATAIDYDNESTLVGTGYTSSTVTLTASPTIASTKGSAGVADMIIAPDNTTGYTGTIVLTTDIARYTYTISSPITFPRNGIKQLGLNLESASCTRVEKHPVGEVFIPATSVSDGDVILITSGNAGTISVMGYQKSNNRDAVSYTIDGGGIISTETMYPLLVKTGTENASYYSLYDNDTDGYLYTASSTSNYLRTQTTNDVDSEWEIELNASSQATTFKATGSSNRQYMQFNSTLFACYSSASYDPVYVFKKTSDTFISAANQDIAYTVTSVTIDYNVYNGSGATTVAFKTNPGDCASNLAINEGTKKVTFDITANAGSTRTVEVNITNNGVTKTVSINQAAAPSKLVMSTITATPAQTQIVFSWDAVDGAAGYQISTNGGTTYGDTQVGTSYTWTSLTAFTEYTIKVKAIGDGIYHLDSDAASKTQKTTLAVPTGITWTKGTKTVSWTDTNTGAGAYGTVYKYQYTIDNGETFTDIASPGTSVALSIDANKTFKIKAICIADSGLNSAVSEGVSCNVGDAHYYTPVTSIETDAKYILVCEYNDVKYICNPVVTSNSLPLVDASSIIVAGKIESSVSNDAYAVTISGSEGAYSISYKDGEDTKYFSVTQSGSSMGKNLISAASEDSKWLITKQSDNSFRFSNDLNSQSQGRAIFIGNSGASCKFYSASNFGNTGYSATYLTLYKYE